MKNLKKFFAAALVCVMALVVMTGCGKTAANYQNELADQLKNANIGVTVDAQMNRTAEFVAKDKVINGAIVDYAASGNSASLDVKTLMTNVLKSASVSEKTKWCVSFTHQNRTTSYGFNGIEVTSQVPATYFVSELKSYNEAHPQEKLTKVGVGLYRTPWIFGGVDVVIMLAE